MDGVLCDSEPYWAAAVIEMFRRRYGLAVTREEFLPFVGAGDDRFISGAAEARGVTVELETDRARAYEIYVDLIRGRMLPIRGVREFLSHARGAGLRLAVATGSGRGPREDACVGPSAALRSLLTAMPGRTAGPAFSNSRVAAGPSNNPDH